MWLRVSDKMRKELLLWGSIGVLIGPWMPLRASVARRFYFRQFRESLKRRM